MTTIALQGQNFSLRILNGFINGVKKTFSNIMFGFILARQMEANARLARLMIHEYRGHTTNSLHAELNRKSVASLKKEFGRD